MIFSHKKICLENLIQRIKKKPLVIFVEKSRGFLNPEEHCPLSMHSLAFTTIARHALQFNWISRDLSRNVILSVGGSKK